jgi:hypothetical protein
MKGLSGFGILMWLQINLHAEESEKSSSLPVAHLLEGQCSVQHYDFCPNQSAPAGSLGAVLQPLLDRLAHITDGTAPLDPSHPCAKAAYNKARSNRHMDGSSS